MNYTYHEPITHHIPSMKTFTPRHTEAAYNEAKQQSRLTYQIYLAAKKAKQPTKAPLDAHRAAYNEAVRIAQESTPPHRHDQKPELVFLPPATA